MARVVAVSDAGWTKLGKQLRNDFGLGRALLHIT